MIGFLLAIRIVAAILSLSSLPTGPDQRGPATPDPPPPPRPTRPPAWTRFIGRLLPFLGFLWVALLLLPGVGVALPDQFAALENDPQTRVGIALAAIVTWATYLLWNVPRWQAEAWAERSGISLHEQFEIETESRQNLGQLISGFAVVAGLFFAWQQFGSTVKQVQINQEQVITDRFTNAVGQIASDSLSVRLGGIYALERIARDSPRDLAPTFEVLAAFVREQTAGRPAGTPSPGVDDSTAADVLAAMKVIGRRDAAQVLALREQGIACLDLTGIAVPGLALPPNANLGQLCLDGATVTGAILPGADFSGSSLPFTDFVGASIEGGRFQDADLTGARFDGALLGAAVFDGAAMTGSSLADAQVDGGSFTSAFLIDADLSGAVIFSATFDRADLTQADLAGATIFDSDLSGAIRLTREQLSTALVGGTTLLPSDLAAEPAP